MTVIRRSELNRMAEIIIDEDTQMTELDYWEFWHSFDDIDIIEDVSE